MADTAHKLLDELEQMIANYSGPSTDRSATEEECLMLQLSGVAESAISQLWFLDRGGLDETETQRIKAFPKRLADLIDSFNQKHDAPLLAEIQEFAAATPPKSYSYAPHQRNIEFFTNQVAQATKTARFLRGTNAQTAVQKAIASIMENVTAEKRKQMNEYQLFVAQCCGLAYEGKALIMSGSFSKDGEILRSWGYSSADDFIDTKIKEYSTRLTSARIRNAANFPAIYYDDDWEIQNALGKSKDFKEERIPIANNKKAFIALAVSGFYRIDQSLLTPETSRLFQDVFQKYYEELVDDDKVKSVRWMVEMPKFKLEDF